MELEINGNSNISYCATLTCCNGVGNNTNNTDTLPRVSDVYDSFPYYEREKVMKLIPPTQKINTRVIVLGSNGMLGAYVYHFYSHSKCYDEENVIGLTRRDFDFGQSSEVVHDYLLKLIRKDDLIINCIGMINKRNSQTAKEELQFWRINTVLPRLIANVAHINKGYLVHITTDCVFNGMNEGWMCRSDLHTSVDLYGLSKSLGDYGLKGYPMVAIIRTSIIGEEINNRSLVEWVLQSGAPYGEPPNRIQGYTNHTWNGVTCLCLANILLNAVRIPENDKLKDLFFGEEHIITTKNVVTKYELVKTIAETCNINVIIEPVEAPVTKHMELSGTLQVQSTIQEQLFQLEKYDICNRRNIT